ncbi:uncharacterized protein [Mobula birostris]|uniref:uncharacterized protein n=1 Tax=Mobula birostris TaxID=1983395 RepID=UPI003B27BD25
MCCGMPRRREGCPSHRSPSRVPNSRPDQARQQSLQNLATGVRSPTNNSASTTSSGAQRPATVDRPANSRETPGPAAADGYGGRPSGQPPVCLGQAVWTPLFGQHRSGDQHFTSDELRHLQQRTGTHPEGRKWQHNTDLRHPHGAATFSSSQFTWDFTLVSLLGTQLHLTTAYHPQSNELVERFHCHLKSALMACLEGPNWVDELSWVLLGIRTAPKEDLHTSSAELVYGAPLVVPGEFIPAPREQEEEPAAVLDRLCERLGNLAPIPTSQHGQRTQRPAELKVSFCMMGRTPGTATAALRGAV